MLYHWDFGDGNFSDKREPTQTFSSEDGTPRRYDVVLTVTDQNGGVATASQVVSVNNTPPQVDITSIDDGALYSLSATSYLPLKASVQDTEHSDDQLSYTWRVFFHHNDHFHPEFPLDSKEAVAIIDPAASSTSKRTR